MNKFFVTMMVVFGMFVGNAQAFEINDVMYAVSVYDLETKTTVYEGKLPASLMGVNTTSDIETDTGKIVGQASVNLQLLPRSFTNDSITVGIGGVFQVAPRDGKDMAYKTVLFPSKDFTFKNEYSYVTDSVDNNGKKYRLVVNTYITSKKKQ